MCDNRTKRQSGGERMSQMICDRKIPTRGGCCIDLYNQQVMDICPSITTRTDGSGLYWVTKIDERDDRDDE